MNKDHKILQYLLLAGFVYFGLASIAHLMEWKIPGLFIYYNVASYEYQNKIIALLLFGWAGFFCLGYLLVRAQRTGYLVFHILSGGYAIMVVGFINRSLEMKTMAPHGELSGYWLGWFCLFLYWVLILIFYVLALGETKQVKQTR